ncbi:MAG: metallophosphoesterase family protein [Janthinobacterium lividum]
MTSLSGPPGGRVLSWLHIGDLHITEAGLENHRDLGRIVALANALPPGNLDFALLPGDNADDGTPEQFALVRDAVAPLRLPLHILPGDHDFKPRSLDAYHAVLGAERLPFAVTLKGHRCLFLDVVSAGTGGPDFRLGADQLAWAGEQLQAAEAAGKGAVVFMHTYPADLREGDGALGTLLAKPQVLCVDMGHTHYNELANDGGTIFMATRSTGQVEEGPPGCSIAAVDGGVVSWRFKALDDAWPFVLVTQPADRRLLTNPAQVVDGPFTVRAKLLGDALPARVEAQVDAGAWVPMAPVAEEVALWSAQIGQPGGTVRVRAVDMQGRTDEDAVQPAHPGWAAPAPRRTAAMRTALAPGRSGASSASSLARTARGRNGRHCNGAGRRRPG